MTQRELESKIQEAQDAYYNGEPIMEDHEFDKLWDELKRNYPSSVFLQNVGVDNTDGFEKAQHVMLMGSQNKANSAAEMNKFFDPNKEYVVDLKFDGLGLEMQYNEGRFVKALTRGDGKAGDDITANAKKMRGVPLRLQDENFTGAVRGEILLLHSDKEKYFKDAANCRNQASGLAKRKDGTDCDKLTVIVYDLFSTNGTRQWPTETMCRTWLQSNGFKTMSYDAPQKWTGEEAIEYMHNLWATRDKVDFDFDGLVFKQQMIDWDDKKSNYRPKSQIALKPARDEAVTEVTSIDWRMTNGTLTPVCQLSPVELNGTTVKQVNAYNAKWLDDMGIEVGDEVVVVKAGMIIPRITKNLRSGKVTKDASN